MAGQALLARIKPLPPTLLKGYLATGGAFLLWGLVPIFWKQFEGIGAFELILHRILWALLFLSGLILLRGRTGAFVATFRSVRLVSLSLLSGALLACNWMLFIWAVRHERVIETSLGYFVAPFVSAALGLFVLGEKASGRHWLALALALAGVGIQLFGHAGFPWFALGLAFSFGLYGLLRKQSSLGSMVGLGVETALLAPFAAVALLLLHADGNGAFGRVDASTHLWLASTGVVTAIPLLLFATGARMIPLFSVGLLQFITPSVSLLLGIYLYGEPFGPLRMASFFLIWIGLAVLLANSFSRPKPPSPASP